MRAATFGSRRGLTAILATYVVAVVCATLAYDSRFTTDAGSPTTNRAARGQIVPGVRVRFEALGTRKTGNTGRPHSEATHELRVGDTAASLLRAGDSTGPSVCNAKFYPADTEVDHLVQWRLEATLVNVSGERTTLRVHAVRSWAGGSPREARNETRDITIGRDEWHVLDYVENPSTSPSSCASLLVRISAQPIVEEVQHPISVDVWTVDETASGETHSVYQHVRGTTGQSIAFKFPPLDVAAGNEAGSNVSVGVEGSLQVVEAADGLLDLSVEARRRTSWAGAETRGEGRVQFRAAPGETAALLLPQPTGTLGTSGSSQVAGMAKLDLARAFAGHRLSLYVKVEPVQ